MANKTEGKALKNDPNRKVKIKLFKDSQRYKEPLYVSVNSYSACIPRGVPVEIPYFVAKHIEEMETQDQNTAITITILNEQYEQNMNSLT